MVYGYLGAEAVSVLNNEAFRFKWDELFEKCLWATAYQDRRYVSLWYELYNENYTPLLLVEENGNSTIGIFPLAIRSNGEVVGAGYPQAEYHCWISRKESQKEFFIHAIQWIQVNLRSKKIHLKYLPHLLSYEELQSDNFLKEISFWKEYSQPIMEINEIALTQEIKKKNRKEKINRLKRLGDLKFEKIETLEDFSAILNDLIVMYEFRKGAVYGNEFFSQDKNKKDFTLRLFEDGLLHVTVLRVGSEIIGANAGIYGKGVVHLQGISAFSPIYSKYSPGILCFLMLGLQMHKEGFLEFDLTPGGIEGYKSDLATGFHKTYELVVTSKKERLKLRYVSNFKDYIKSNLTTNGLQFLKTDNLGSLKDELKKGFLSLLKEGPKNFLDKKNSLYEPFKNLNSFILHRPEAFSKSSESDYVRKNRLDDLLLFSEKESVITKKNFLLDAMRRLEFGHQVYTLVKERKTLACLWYIPKDSKMVHTVQAKSTYPTVFLKTYQIMDMMEGKLFLSNAIRNIFQTDNSISTLHFKARKNDTLIGKLIDHDSINSKLEL